MPEEQVSIWERMERPAQAPKATLTHERIGETAVELADAEGLDSVSIRRLAARLGVTPMALYRYISGKEEIYELMVDAVYRPGPSFETAPKDWRTTLSMIGHGTRQIMLAHPWLSRVLTLIVTGLTPNRLAAAERALSALDDLGLDADTKMAVLESVLDYAHGAAGREISLAGVMRREGWTTGEELRNGLAAPMKWHMSTGRYPSYHRYMQEARRKDDFDWRFDFGLECVLNGIAARLGI